MLGMNRRKVLGWAVKSAGIGIYAGLLKDTPKYADTCAYAVRRSNVAFADDVVGGDNGLIRSWIKSPDFQTGVQGWIIRKDGSVEFNNGVFRGSITSGTNPGKHLVINDPGTGDAIDIYDASNRLVFDITSDGVLDSILQPSGLTISIQGNGAFFHTQGVTSLREAAVTGESDNSGSYVNIDSGSKTASFVTSSLRVMDGVSSGTGDAFILAQQTIGGTAVNGALVQTDMNGTNKFMHAGTTLLGCGAGGLWNQAHNCGFKPTLALVTEQGPAGTIPLVFIVDNTAFTATNWSGHAFNGGAAFVGSVSVNTIFIG